MHPTQVRVALSQMGAPGPQLADVRHCTHLLVLVSQTGVAPEQFELPPHSTQAPAVEHTECPASMAAHWVEDVHGPQVPAVQIGAVAGQVALVMHPTQAPVAEHKVRAGSPSPTHWLDEVQAVQAPPEQTGALAGQLADVRHCTHLFVLVSQTAVVPEQFELSPHCTHWPSVRQIGVAALLPAHWLALVHETQLPLTQMGTVAGHAALVWHCGEAMSTAPPSLPGMVESIATGKSGPASLGYFSQPGIPGPSHTQSPSERSQRTPLVLPV